METETTLLLISATTVSLFFASLDVTALDKKLISHTQFSAKNKKHEVSDESDKEEMLSEEEEMLPEPVINKDNIGT